MTLDENNDSGYPVSPGLHGLLTGLLRQREELGSVADEILDLLQEHGARLPPEAEGEAELMP